MDDRIIKLRDELLKGILSNKKELLKKYGKDAEKIAYATAMKQAKSQFDSKQQGKIQEIIKTCLSTPPSFGLDKKIHYIDSVLENEYEKLIYDYEPTSQEIEAFERDKQGISSKPELKKEKYTGNAEIQVKRGLNKWETFKQGPIKIMKSLYNKLPNKSEYRFRYEVE